MGIMIGLSKGVWTELPITKAGRIRHQRGKGQVIYCIFDSTPSTIISNVAVMDTSVLGGKVYVDGVPDGMKVYALPFEEDCFISVTQVQSSIFPDGTNAGLRALNVQFYDESNKKLGSQWEASRRITGVANNAFLYSVLRIGSTYPIDLKSRTLGATGAGVIGRIYELYPEDILSFGTPDPWYNMRFDKADPATYQPDAEIYPEPQVTFVGGQTASSFAIPSRKRGADLFEETSSQNQSKGFTSKQAGSNRIFYQNRIALLEIQSLDSQNINARLEMFEGFLDLPLP